MVGVERNKCQLLKNKTKQNYKVECLFPNAALRHGENFRWWMGLLTPVRICEIEWNADNAQTLETPSIVNVFQICPGQWGS